MVQQILQKSTDFLRRVIVPDEGQGGVTLSYVCPDVHQYPLEDYICFWWVSAAHGDVNNKTKKKQCNWWCAACGGRYVWRNPNRILLIQDSGVCDQLVNALKLLANEVTVGWKCWLRASQERMIEGLRRFITVENHEAVKIGDLEKTQFTTDLLETMVREGAYELTLQRQEAGMLRTLIDTTNVRDSR